MKESFLTISEAVTYSFEIKKSTFICHMKPIDNEDDCKAFIKEMKEKYTDCRHLCYAYICDEKGYNFKYSDGGEPQGTAGVPMIEVLRNKNLYMVGAVVIRYFGGIKLGTGGLAHAYSDSVIGACNLAKVVEKFYSKKLSFSLPYTHFPKLQKILNNYKSKVIKSDYLDDGVTLEIVVKESETSKLKGDIQELTSGKANVVESEFGYERY